MTHQPYGRFEIFEPDLVSRMSHRAATWTKNALCWQLTGYSDSRLTAKYRSTLPDKRGETSMKRL
jgi:hypothetical protein